MRGESSILYCCMPLCETEGPSYFLTRCKVSFLIRFAGQGPRDATSLASFDSK